MQDDDLEKDSAMWRWWFWRWRCWWWLSWVMMIKLMLKNKSTIWWWPSTITAFLFKRRTKKKKSELKRGCFANMDLCYSLLRGLSQYISNTSYMAALHKNHDDDARHMNECNLLFLAKSLTCFGSGLWSADEMIMFTIRFSLHSRPIYHRTRCKHIAGVVSV